MEKSRNSSTTLPTGDGVLRGSDVDWQEYRVVDGLAKGLVLNEEEMAWLRKVWTEAKLSIAKLPLWGPGGRESR